MSSNLLDFWPQEIHLDVLSPAMILNQQAAALGRRTKWFMSGEVVQDQHNGVVRLHFDLVAPKASYRQRFLTVRYFEGTVYPAVVTSSWTLDSPLSKVKLAPSWGVTDEEADRSEVAYCPNDFAATIQAILGSNRAKASILSPIARHNEAKHPPQLVTMPSSLSLETAIDKSTDLESTLSRPVEYAADDDPDALNQRRIGSEGSGDTLILGPVTERTAKS